MPADRSHPLVDLILEPTVQCLPPHLISHRSRLLAVGADYFGTGPLVGFRSETPLLVLEPALLLIGGQGQGFSGVCLPALDLAP
jgi:hypothetical protein